MLKLIEENIIWNILQHHIHDSLTSKFTCNVKLLK